MQVIEKIAHWTLAVFIAALVYFGSLLLSAFLILKLLGLPTGIQASADFKPPIGTTGLTVLFGIIIFAPLALATFAGAMTTPFAQRGVAATLFPVLVFGTVTWMTRNGHHWGITWLLEALASCAIAGGLVYIRWRRQRLRITRI